MRRISLPWTELALVLIGLFTAELGIRAVVSARLLSSPEPLLWHRREVHTKLGQMQALEHENHIDVLFVGSSVAYTGVNPLVFDSEFESETGLAIVSYNAGLAALPVSMVELFAEHVFLDQVSPECIVFLVSPRDFNTNNPTNQALVDEVMSSVYGQAMLGSGVKSTLTRFLLKWSSLFRYRSTIWIAVLNGFMAPEQLPSSYNDPQFDARGYSPGYYRLSDRLSVKGDIVFRNEKAIVALRNYDPLGENIASLERLIQLCQSKNIRLILVSVPLTEYFIASFEQPDTDYQVYLEAVTTLADKYEVPWWDMNHPLSRDLFSDDDFQDVFHLNDHGATKLSQILAQLYVED